MHAAPLIPDLIKLARDIEAACRRDPDGVVRITLAEVVAILKDLGVIVVDVAL